MKHFKQKTSRGAFTLVEVMLAVGVIAVSITAMIGLLSAITANLNQIRYQNKAVAIIANLETTLKMKSFAQVFDWVKNPAEPYVVYFWDEYQNPDEPDNSSMVTMSSELDGFTPEQPPSMDNLQKSEGEVFRVLLSLYENGLKGQKTNIGDETEYAGGSLTDVKLYALAYLPIKVEILVDPKDDVITGSGDETINEPRRVSEDQLMKMR